MSIEDSPTVAAATQIAAGDDRTHYDSLAMALHWLTTFLVLMQFALAELWSFAPRPTRHLMIVAHVSFGILLALVLIVRITWRLIPGHRVLAATTGWKELASKTVHYVLYGLLATQAVLGFMLRWSGDEAMSFFGLLIPPPFAPFSKSIHELIGGVHNWLGWSIIILATGHALAALSHHFILRDNVLWRMLPGRRARQAAARRPATERA